MKILRDGKEVKDAKVTYEVSGRVYGVVIDGVTYDPKAFKFEETEEKVKNKDSKEKQPKDSVQKTAKKS